MLTTAPISGFPREDRPVGPGDEANSKTAPGDPAAGDGTSIAATQAPDTITERGTVRQHHRTAIDSITRLVMPEECFFGVFGIALIALVIATGQVHLVIARLVADLRFVAIVVGVALVIFVRAYRRAGPGPTPTVGLDRARLRIGVAVAVRTLREFGSALRVSRDLRSAARSHADHLPERT